MELSGGELYFLREIDPHTKAFTLFVKVGLVRDDPKDQRTSRERASEHQTGNPRELSLPEGNFFKTLGISRLESLMHKYLASKRVSGEWFEFADEPEVEAAKTQARAWSAEIAENAEAFHEAKALAKVLSTEPVKEPTATAAALIRELSEIKVKKARLTSLQLEIKAKLKVAIEQGEKVEHLVEKKLVNYAGKFDADSFAAKYPDLYNAFLRSTTAVKGSFSPKYIKEVDLQLDEEFLVRIAEFQNVIDSSSQADRGRLNSVQLSIMEELSSLEWESEVADSKLRVECGKAAGIEGVVTWKRESKTTTKFEEAKLKEAEPEIYAQFLSEGEQKEYINPKKKKI